MRFFMIISLAALSFATASQADGHMGDLQMQPLLRSSETLLGTEFSYPEGKALITSALATLPAGGVIPKHFHPSPMYVHILEGVITSEYNGKTMTFMAGDTYIKPANENHTVRNLGINDVKAILVSIGAEGLKLTIPVKD